jgi:type IV conjugative transfer system protein TraE
MVTMNEGSLRLQKNFLLGLLVLGMFGNVLLALKLYKQESTVIMVPSIDRELRVGSHIVFDEYLRLRAEQVINLFFSMREGTAKYVTDALLKQADSDTYLEFKKQLEALAADIKARGYRYLFIDIQKFEIDNHNLTVTVSGYLETYLADRMIEKKFKKYLLSFSNHGGLVKLKAFAEEVVDEKNK